MTDTIFIGGVVITMDDARRVIDGGAVAVRGERILAVGKPDEVLARAGSDSTVIDARSKAILPGLIDSHAHAGHGLVKTMAGGDSAAWFKAVGEIYTVGSDEEFWRAEAALSALERLKGGVTLGVSLLGGGDSVMRTDDVSFGAAHMAAVATAGTRSIVAIGPNRPPHPWTYARWDGETRRAYPVDFERQMEVTETLLRDWHGAADGRISVCINLPVQKTDPASLEPGLRAEIRRQARIVRAFAREHGLRFTQDGHCEGTIAIANDEYDLLGPDVFLSHCIDMSEREIALARETGTSIVTNPYAIMAIRGRCPVPELIDAGVNVAIGSDGTAPDRSYDMFRHMAHAIHYHRRHFRDGSILPAGKALEMVTIDAARALGREQDLGSLEEGKLADVVLVDMRKPHLFPRNMPVYRIVHFANAGDVDTVMIGGRIVMQGRRVTTLDEDKVLDDAEAACATMLARTGFDRLLADPPNLWRSSRY